MSDTIENIEALAQSIAQSNEYLLERVYNKDELMPYHIIKYTQGGAQGGNCWGSDARSYENDISDKMDSKEGDFLYFLKTAKLEFDSEAYENLIYHAIDVANVLHEDSNSEYYGNYTNYEYVGIPVEEIAKLFTQPEDAKVFVSAFEKAANTSLNNLHIQELQTRLEGLTRERDIEQKNLDNHAKLMEQRQKSLENEKNRLEQRLIQINLDLARKTEIDNREEQVLVKKIDRSNKNIDEVTQSIKDLGGTPAKKKKGYF